MSGRQFPIPFSDNIIGPDIGIVATVGEASTLVQGLKSSSHAATAAAARPELSSSRSEPGPVKRLVDIAFNGNSFPICQPIRKGWAHDPSITVDEQCKFDLDLAKSLLSQAGYPNGFKMEALVSSEVMPESTILAQIMKEDLAKIGVELNILDLEQTAYNNTGDKSLYKDMYIQIVGRTNKDPGSLFFLRRGKPPGVYDSPLLVMELSTFTPAPLRKVRSTL